MALLIFAAGVAMSGCTSTKAIWNSRVGVYTFDQAVLELGPPDKAAQLKDGTTVAEWMTRRGYPGGYVSPYYGYPLGYDYRRGYWAAPYYYEPGSPDYFLRLTFGPDAQLQAWQRITR
jgi:hypothetical protein